MYSQLGPGSSFFAVLKKNIVLIALGSLVVGGILYVPMNENSAFAYDSSLSTECPLPIPYQIDSFHFTNYSSTHC